MTAPIPIIARGTCNASFAYDLGFAIDLDHAAGCLAVRAQTAATSRETLRHARRAPRHFQYQPSPLAVTRAAEPLTIAGFRSEPTVEAIVHDFGVVSIRYGFPIAGPLDGVLPLADALYENAALLDDSRRRAAELLDYLGPAITRPELSPLVEDYFIYRVEAFEPATSPGDTLAAHRSLIARLLRSERGPLSPQEIEDANGVCVMYSPDDAAIIDWNASLLLGPGGEDTAAVLEFANVELLELRFLDDRLDRALAEAYEAVQRQSGPADLFSTRIAADLRRIAAFQLDSALLFEGVNNALKLLGDQYLARVYRLAGQRLHLPEWDASILRKLGTLREIYDKVSDRLGTRRMEALEWIVIGLIAFEVVMGLLHLR